jgi:hypothetical protein
MNHAKGTQYETRIAMAFGDGRRSLVVGRERSGTGRRGQGGDRLGEAHADAGHASALERAGVDGLLERRRAHGRPGALERADTGCSLERKATQALKLFLREH